jgi:hypothetical protein
MTGYLPSVMLLGRPVSQDLGAFQGRTEALSTSVLAQPVREPRVATAKQQSNNLKIQTGSFMKRDLQG